MAHFTPIILPYRRAVGLAFPEPLLRVFAEMPTEAEAKAVCASVRANFGI